MATSEAPLMMKIKEKWVRVDVWAKTHPGGALALERFRNRDATEIFTTLHSKSAWNILNKMKPMEQPALYVQEESRPSSVAFLQFREQLEKEGWFDRNWLWDAFYIMSITILCGLGTYLAYDYPILASFLIGLGMQQAGWIGHDYVHGRGKASYILGRGIGGLFNAFSSEWWSDKHNYKHHVHTNQVGVDDDIANDPILHLYLPKPEKEFSLRPYQHIYYHFVYTFLYVSWRIQSFQYAWANGFKIELLLMVINYLWLATLPLRVALLSILIGGFLVAEIVTATHQSEEMLEGLSYNFVEDQFATTRDVAIANPFFNWLWGGMQFQLEHHLFPTMPKYRYSEVSRRVMKFAKENGLHYRTSGMVEIFKMNYETMKRFAAPLQK